MALPPIRAEVAGNLLRGLLNFAEDRMGLGVLVTDRPEHADGDAEPETKEQGIVH